MEFVGAAREIHKLVEFAKDSDEHISNICTTQDIHVQWKFTPEHAPHFGGLWEAAIKSMKKHFRRIVGDVKLTFEELTAVVAKIEACLNSRPMTEIPEAEDGIEAVTFGHLLIGHCCGVQLFQPSGVISSTRTI